MEHLLATAAASTAVTWPDVALTAILILGGLGFIYLMIRASR
jgi:hypothetical protein